MQREALNEGRRRRRRFKIGKEGKKQGVGITLRSRGGKGLDNFMAQSKQKKERVEKI